METSPPFYDVDKDNSSYRTYEEWKLAWQHLLLVRLSRSYRTYEEWKLFLPSPILIDEPRSYRTYEEWKRMERITWKELMQVLTVPMRNGNFL